LLERKKVKTSRTIRVTAYLLGLAGAALLTGLIIHQGAAEVGAAVARAGWGFVAIVGLHLVKLLSDTAGWLILIPKPDRPRLHTALWMHWVGESVSNLLPAARVGGDILTARLAAMQGVPLIMAAASVLVDLTCSVFTKIVFTVTGLTLLVVATSRTDLVFGALMTQLVAILAVGGFYAVQRLGIFRWGAYLASLLGKSGSWHSLVQSGEALDRTVQTLYTQRERVAGCCGFSLISWLLSAGQVWIALHALGLPATFITALILESVAQGVRDVMFLVPGALGVQESGYLVFGGLLGIAGETALALSLIRRVRELTLGVPGLIVWQLIEGRRAWRKRSVQSIQQLGGSSPAKLETKLR
jgi:putative membrane protein